MVAAVSGRPYADYMRAHVLEPLRLTSTTPDMPEAERAGRLATGYSALTRDGVRIALPFFQVRGIAPAAGFASTAEDLARFAAWQFKVLGQGSRDVLAPNTLREMQRVHWVDPDFETTWGLGFAVWRRDGKSFTGHGGSCPGYRTQLLLKPDDRISTIFLSNALGVNSGQWTQRMYDIVAPAIKAATKPAVEPGAPAPKPPDPALSPYIGTYESAFGGELAVVRWEDGLAILDLPTMDPIEDLTRLRKVGEHTFRRIRKDDETLGETIVFEMDADGRPARLIWNFNFFPRRR